MKVITFALVWLYALPLHQWLEEIIIWNVQQGQFITYVHQQSCLHFDIGGESFTSLEAFLKKCQKKQNFVFITHWDWDHHSFLKLAQKYVPDICLAMAPATQKHSHSLPRCQKPVPQVTTLRMPTNDKFSKNDNSFVYIVGHILIPGDSTKKAEKYWVKLLPNPGQIKVLIAGHHGSQTSSSRELLRRLKNLTMVIVSARKKKYGHPHQKTRHRVFTVRKLKLITTQAYGHLIIKL